MTEQTRNEWTAATDGLTPYEDWLVDQLITTRDKLKEAEQEENHLHKLVWRQGRLLTGVVNAIRGEPDEMTLWSHHDAPELAARAMELLRNLRMNCDDPALAIETDYREALDAVDVFLPPVKPLTDPGVALPGWEEVSRKAERGEPLTPVEAFIMRLTPGDDARAEDFRRMLRAALDSVVRS